MSGNIFYSNANRLHVGAAAASAAKTSDVIKEWLPTQAQSTVVATVLWNLAALGFVLNAGLLLRYLRTKLYLLPLPPPAIVVNLCGSNLLLVFGVLLATATLTLDLGDSGVRAGQAQLFFTVCVLLQSWLGQVMLVYCMTWMRHDSRGGATREKSERSGNMPVGGIFNSLRPNSRRRRRKLGHLHSSELSDERQQEDGVRTEFGGVRMQGTATCKESSSKEPLTSATMLAMTRKQNKVVKWWLVWSWLLSLLAATALLMTTPGNSQDVCLTLDPFRRKYLVTGVDVQHLRVMENGVLKVPLMLVLVPVYVLGIAVVIRSAVQRAKSSSGSGLGLNQRCPPDESSADGDDDEDKGGASAFYVVNRFNRRKLGGGINACDVNRDTASWNVNLNALRAVRYPKARDRKKGPENHLSRSVHGPGQSDSVQQRGMRLMVAESDNTAHLSQLTSRIQQRIQEENPTDARNKNKNSRQISPLTTNVEHNNVKDSERTDNSDKRKEKQSHLSSKNKQFRADTIDKDEATHIALLSINNKDEGESVFLPFADEADNDSVESETFDTASSSEYYKYYKYNITKLATGDDDDESDAKTESLASNIATLSKTHNRKLATEPKGLFFDDTVDLDLFDTDEYAIHFNESEMDMMDMMPPGHNEVRAEYLPDSFRRASIYSEEQRPVREDIQAYTDHVLYIPLPQGSNVIANQLTHYQDRVQGDLYESPVEAFSVEADNEVSVQEPVSSGTTTKSSNDMDMVITFEKNRHSLGGARPESAMTCVESSWNKRKGFKRVSFTVTDGIHRYKPNSTAAAATARACGQSSKGNAARPIANSRPDSTKAGQNSQEVDQMDIVRHASGRGSGDSKQESKQGTKAVKTGMAQPALKVSTASPKKTLKTRVAESREEKNTFAGKLRVHSPTVAGNCREGSNKSRPYVVSREEHFQPRTKHVHQPEITDSELTGQPTVARLTTSPTAISDDDSRLILTEDRQQYCNLNNSANKHRSKAHTSKKKAPGAQLEKDVKVGEHPTKDLLASGGDPCSIDDRAVKTQTSFTVVAASDPLCLAQSSQHAEDGTAGQQWREAARAEHTQGGDSGACEGKGEAGKSGGGGAESHTKMNRFGVTQPLQQPSSGTRLYGYPDYSRFQRPCHPEYPELFPKTRSGAARSRLSTHFTHQCPKGATGQQEQRKQLAQAQTVDNDVVNQREVATTTQTTASQGPSGSRQENKSSLSPRLTASQAGIKKREQHGTEETPTSSNGQTDSEPPGDLITPSLHHSSINYLASQQPTPQQQQDLGETLHAPDNIRDTLACVGDSSRRPPAKLSGTSLVKEGRQYLESRPDFRRQGAGDGDTGVTEVEHGKRLTGRAAWKNLSNKGKERSFWWKRVVCSGGCGYEWKCVVGLLLHVLLCLPFVVSLAPGVWEGRDCGVRLQVQLTVRLLFFCQVVACPLWLLSFHGRALFTEK
ncbi:uncharacterized protein [Littorina saxatilis]|uniref:Uncharacterized protein n=1 Tax=Littorina saxatilis TaxID=31220 RepID=A0AAN9B1X4_9CAEN